MLAAFQDESRATIVAQLQLVVHHPVWSRGGWKVFLGTPDDIERTIRNIERNPLEVGLPVQRWPFITLYDGWPFHRR